RPRWFFYRSELRSVSRLNQRRLNKTKVALARAQMPSRHPQVRRQSIGDQKERACTRSCPRFPFGPLGILYVSVKQAIIAFVLMVLLLAATAGLAWPIIAAIYG